MRLVVATGAGWEGAFFDPGTVEVRFEIPLAALFSAVFNPGCATGGSGSVRNPQIQKKPSSKKSGSVSAKGAEGPMSKLEERDAAPKCVC